MPVPSGLARSQRATGVGAMTLVVRESAARSSVARVGRASLPAHNHPHSLPSDFRTY